MDAHVICQWDMLHRCDFLYLHWCRDSHADNFVRCDDVYASGELAKKTGAVVFRMAKAEGARHLKPL